MRHIFRLIMRHIFRLISLIQFGKITEHIIATAGYNVPAEVEFRGRRGKVVGFWAYGYWHPEYPYKGE
jgi:hypothetical protein